MKPSCCHRPEPTPGSPAPRIPQGAWLRRSRGAAGWILPATLLALLPKCPLCLAAYVALATGITLSAPSAHFLLRALTTLGVGMLALCVARLVVRSPAGKHTFHLLSERIRP